MYFVALYIVGCGSYGDISNRQVSNFLGMCMRQNGANRSGTTQ